MSSEPVGPGPPDPQDLREVATAPPTHPSFSVCLPASLVVNNVIDVEEGAIAQAWTLTGAKIDGSWEIYEGIGWSFLCFLDGKYI